MEFLTRRIVLVCIASLCCVIWYAIGAGGPKEVHALEPNQLERDEFDDVGDDGTASDAANQAPSFDRAYELLPKGRRFAHAGVITVTFGEPIHPPAFTQITDHYAAFGTLASRVQQPVLRLSAEASRA